MTTIRLVTDSTADIPAEVREALGIEMIPLRLHFGNETYLDDVTIDSKEFYRKLAGAKDLPTTSQPSPMDFLDVYEKLAKVPDVCILSIHLSSALSGTYQSAVLAKSMLEEKADITVIDSKSATYGIGLLVVAAAQAARDGKGKEEILELIERLRRETSIYFMVDTLEYLQKGGRIGKAAGLLGSLLNIKPILWIDEEGEVASVDKVRGQKRAMARIMELLKERYTGPVNVTVVHGDSLESAQNWGALAQEHLQVNTLLYNTIGPVIGTHAGIGAIAVIVVPAQ